MTPLIFLLFAVGFFVVWFTNRNLESSRWFAVSYLMGSLAFLFEMLISWPDQSALLVFFTDTFYFATVFFFVVAVARKYDAPVPLTPLFALTTVCLAANAW